jgi:hypothetical protein
MKNSRTGVWRRQSIRSDATGDVHIEGSRVSEGGEFVEEA